MKKYKEIEFVLENCEGLKVKAENIRYLNFFKICEDITCNFDGDVFKIKLAKHISLSIGNADKAFEYSNASHSSTEPFKRIQANDITAIIMYYEDGTEEQINVPWKNKNKYTNKLQRTSIVKSASDKKEESGKDIFINIEIGRKNFWLK